MYYSFFDKIVQIWNKNDSRKNLFFVFATYCLKFIFHATKLYAKTYLMQLANNLKANFSYKNSNIKNEFFRFLLKFDFRLFAKRLIYAKIDFSIKILKFCKSFSNLLISAPLTPVLGENIKIQALYPVVENVIF